MMPAEIRAEITEKIHNIMDLLREHPDESLSSLCDRMLFRLDILALTEREDCE